MCESINGTIIETLIRSAVTWSSRPPISCNGFGGDDLPPGVDPIIAGLIARLPESGSEWSIQKRELWLAILKSTCVENP